MKIRKIIFFGCCLLISAPAESQQTVGNGTVFVPTAGQNEAYGLRGLMNESGSGFPTRHVRMGSSTGIGQSYLQTTAPTADSNRAMSSYVPTVQLEQMRSPSLNRNINNVFGSPATGANEVRSVALPRVQSFDALSNPLTAPTNYGGRVEDLPSFSPQKSPTDLLRFRPKYGF